MEWELRGAASPSQMFIIWLINCSLALITCAFRQWNHTGREQYKGKYPQWWFPFQWEEKKKRENFNLKPVCPVHDSNLPILLVSILPQKAHTYTVINHGEDPVWAVLLPSVYVPYHEAPPWHSFPLSLFLFLLTSQSIREPASIHFFPPLFRCTYRKICFVGYFVVWTTVCWAAAPQNCEKIANVVQWLSPPYTLWFSKTTEHDDMATNFPILIHINVYLCLHYSTFIIKWTVNKSTNYKFYTEDVGMQPLDAASRTPRTLRGKPSEKISVTWLTALMKLPDQVTLHIGLKLQLWAVQRKWRQDIKD